MARTSAYKARINTNSADTNAVILLADGGLVGVLVELSDECHGADHGKWVIEAAFGIDEARVPASFASASDAANWLSTHVACGRFILAGQVPELH